MRVAIVSVAQTEFGTHPGWRPHELTYLAVEEALSKAGLPFRDGYDEIVTCSSDHWEGKTLTDIEHGEAAGAHLGPAEEKVSMDGANAVLLGCVKILSGHAEVVLVTAACKETDVKDPSVIENFGFDPTYQQAVGLDFTQAAALQAVRFMHTRGLVREDFAEVVARSRRNTARGQKGSEVSKITVAEVLKSPMLAYPITTMDRRPFCDGACALILASENKASELTDRPVWIRGFGSCYEPHNLGDRDLAEPEALRGAARDAYDMADIKEPSRQIDLYEISEHYSYQLLLWMEALGLCREGESAALLRSGRIDAEGQTPVNPSGGLLRGVPRYVAGADRVIEAFYHVRGDSDLGGPAGRLRVALAHGTYGPAGQHHCVIIMERGF